MVKDPDGDGRHAVNTRSLGLPSVDLAMGRVQVTYAPEKGTPSPLFQLKINGTQRCQVVINRWGIVLPKSIALKIFASYVTGQVETRDVYGFRNNLEAIASAAQDRGEAHLAFF